MWAEGLTRTSFPLFHPHSAHFHFLTFSLVFLLWMIISRNISLDTYSSLARTHFGTSFLKFKRHQDFLCNYKRTWGKYPSRKNFTPSSIVAEANLDMSLKSDSEPNNNVSIEEEVRITYYSNLIEVYLPSLGMSLEPLPRFGTNQGYVHVLSEPKHASSCSNYTEQM